MFASLLAFGCADEAENGAGNDQADAQAAPDDFGGFGGPSHGGPGGPPGGPPGQIPSEFKDPIPKGNGRACATCHVPSKNFTVSPADAEARFQANPNDPLFRSIDADDFANDYTTVRTKALFRVTIPLPANINLVGSTAREVKLFRAVPTVFNVKLTTPFTHDGRAASLFDQAQGAALEHSRPKNNQLPNSTFFNKIVSFQEKQFSSPAVKYIADKIAAGQTPPAVGQDYDGPLNALEQQGFADFQEHCIACHGGNARNKIDQTQIPLNFFTAFVSERNAAGLPMLEYDVTDTATGITKRVASPDPGRMLISGNVGDLNFFDPTQLRGVSKTAPYFHDNSAPTIQAMLEHYNILFTAFGFPLIRSEQFPRLTAYLNRL